MLHLLVLMLLLTGMLLLSNLMLLLLSLFLLPLFFIISSRGLLNLDFDAYPTCLVQHLTAVAGIVFPIQIRPLLQMLRLVMLGCPLSLLWMVLWLLLL